MSALLTLVEALKLKPALRAFLIVLKTRLEVEVGPNKSRRLKIDLESTDQAIINTQQKLATQAEYHDSTEQAQFVAKLDQPGVHKYNGRAPWRWGSAGYGIRLIIEGEAYWAFLLRIGVKPVGWNLHIGATSSEDELLRPQDAAERKGKLELIVIDVSTRKYQRLEVCGGKYMPMKLHQKVLRTMCVTAHMSDEPLIGTVAGDMPDVVYVKAGWQKDLGPFVSARGLVILNPENGEIGLEFVQVVEWELSMPKSALRLFDGEMFGVGSEASGHQTGQPIGQPIGLFRERDIIREIQKDSPKLKPCVVYENGFAHSDADLERWLANHPDWQYCCPVTLKTLRRYLLHVRGLGNSIVRLPSGDWSLTFDGHRAEWKHHRGFKTLVHLIENQGRQVEFHEIDAQYRAPVQAQAGDSVGALAELSLEGVYPITAYAEKTFDEKRLKARLLKLGIDIKELKEEKAAAQAKGNDSSVEEIQADIDRYVTEAEGIRELLAAGKRQGTPHFTSDASRQRHRIRRSLQRVLKDFQDKDRQLSEHFRQYLNYGRHCIYQPPPQFTWEIRRKSESR